MRYLRRYTDGERINHWIVVLLFLGAALSGLALFHPALYFFSGLFGGGSWARIAHPFFGVLMVLAFAGLFARLWRDNRWQRDDTLWLKHSGSLLRGRNEGLPPVGRYNAGQKLVFWIAAVCLLVLLVTGFLFWRPYFADLFPIPVKRIAVLLHAAAAAVLVITIIVHVYAAIWVKGSTRAMMRGTVSESWARHHHPLWWRSVRDVEERP